MVNTDPCKVYGQVPHSNPDMDSVEGLRAGPPFESRYGLPFFLLPKKNTYKVFEKDLQPTISVLTFTDITTSIAMVINAIF